jgi:peroxiredoxin
VRSKVLTGLLILVLGLFVIYQYRKFRIPPEIPFSNLSLTRLDGSSFSFKSLTGKHLVIQFFATWCGDCRRELPELTQQAKYLDSKNVEVLLISDEPGNTLKSFQERYGLPFEILILQGGFKQNQIYTLPTAYLICSDGKVVYQKTGAISWTQPFIAEQFDLCN